MASAIAAAGGGFAAVASIIYCCSVASPQRHMEWKWTHIYCHIHNTYIHYTTHTIIESETPQRIIHECSVRV